MSHRRQMLGSLLAAVAIVAVAIAITTAKFGATSEAERELQEERIEQRQDAAKERRKQAEDAAKQREDRQGSSGRG